MSSQRWLVGKGKGSMPGETVLYKFLQFEPPPIDSPLPTCLLWNDIGGWLYGTIKSILTKQLFPRFFGC